jgi:integrase
MAYLRVIKSGSFRAICTRYNKATKKQEQKAVFLDTDAKGIAQLRLREVEKLESDVMNGDKIAWSWKEDDVVKSHIVLETLSDGIKKFLERSKSLRKATIESNAESLEHLKSALGDIPLMQLKKGSGLEFRKYLEAYQFAGRNIKKNTINNRIRSANTFFKFLKDNEHIDIDISIKQVTTEKGEPTYFSESEWDRIINYEKLTNRYRRAYKMYYELGFRLSMPFKGRIEGNVFICPANVMKMHRDFKCIVNQEQKDTILMMQQLYADNPTKDAIKWYSKKFAKVLKALGIECRVFHSIRHTFGLRRCIQGINLWQVRDEMGHDKLASTEIYTRVFRPDIEAHFPKLIKATKDTTPKDTLERLQGVPRA